MEFLNRIINNDLKSRYLKIQKSIDAKKKEAKDLSIEFQNYKKQCEELIKSASLNNDSSPVLHIQSKYNKYFINYVGKLEELKKSVDKLDKRRIEIEEEIEKGSKKINKKDKFKIVMGEFEKGVLLSSNGSVVTDRDQALEIAYLESGLNKAEIDAAIVIVVEGFQKGIVSKEKFEEFKKEIQCFLPIIKGNKIKGGLADKISIEDIAKKHNVEIDHINDQLKIGVKVEKEHTQDKEEAEEIAKDHLIEDPDYYTKLGKMEKSEEDFIEKAKQSILGQYGIETLNKIEEVLKSAKKIDILAKEEEEPKSQKKYADAIIMNDNGQILFLCRTKDVSFEPGKYCLPGGHIDEGETPKEAVVREVLEETGLKVKDCYEVAKSSNPEIHYFNCYIEEPYQIILVHEEHSNYEFIGLNDEEWKNIDLIMNLKENLEKMYDNTPSVKNLSKSEDNYIEKSVLDLSKLIAKKVQVQGKGGKIYMATRWVNPETDQPHSHFSSSIVATNDVKQDVLNVLNSTLSKSDKIRNLIDLGIYDKSLVSTLVGVNYSQAHQIFARAEIDTKQLNDRSESVKDIIRQEQKINDTPEGRANNPLLRTISMDELWENYERNLKKVALGRHKFAIAYGLGGVGKTYTFNQIAKNLQLREYDDEIQPNKDQYDYVLIGGKITPSQVYAEMYRHRDKLIVFDDCDSFLATEQVQGFLKRGLDTGEDTKISNKSSKKIYQVEGDPESGTIPNTFKFTGRVIAISNLTTDQLDQAVLSRALCSNLSMTIDETISKLETIKNRIQILTADKSEVIDVSQKARDFAFEVLKKNKEKLGNNINTRAYSNAILIAHDAFEDGFSEDRVEREIVSFFDSITGHFDKIMRKDGK